MSATISATQLIFVMCDLAFQFWPLLMLGTLRKRRKFLHNMLFFWGILAVMRVFLWFNPDPIPTSFLMAEPLNTLSFLALGLSLLGITYGLKAWKQHRFSRKTGAIDSIEQLLALAPSEFEEMTVELFQAYGHVARRTGTTGDHGVDVIVQTKKGEKCIVQCKRWRGPVGEPIVRDFYGVLQHEKADKGIIISTGKFSRPAQEWARGKPITLYDGEKFLQLWQRALLPNPLHLFPNHEHAPTESSV